MKNAAQTIQRLMDSVCQPLDFVYVYLELDDILVASVAQTEHREHLFRLFKKLQKIV